MAKLMILVALLVLATSMAEASIYRKTTVTTYETLDDNDGHMSSKCQDEMRQVKLDSCREFMRSGEMMLRTFILRDDDKEQKPPQECCSNLSNVSQECRCPIVHQMKQDMWGELGQQQQQEMATRADHLTEMCDLSPKSCQSQQQPSFF